VSITYTVPTLAKTLIVHRPPFNAPRDLTPFVAIGNDDVPDGNTEYPVPTPDTALNARFGGTYLVMLTNLSWANPASSRTLTVTVNQYEQPGGNVTSQTATRTITPNTDITNGIVRLDFLTIPHKALPQDNTNAIYTVNVTSGQTGDRFYDVLFLDTQGSTIIVNSNTGYSSLYLDEPTLDQDIGFILGSQFDRADAISILDQAQISGEPMSIDPHGNFNLLCYAVEGAPNVQLNYFPRWYLDRLM
jgi:hypothetical protein